MRFLGDTIKTELTLEAMTLGAIIAGLRDF
jgi:hypothetical protein